MPQKLVTITVGMGSPKVEEHLSADLAEGWRVVMLAAAAAGVTAYTATPQPPRAGQPPGGEVGRMATCVAVLLERPGEPSD